MLDPSIANREKKDFTAKKTAWEVSKLIFKDIIEMTENPFQKVKRFTYERYNLINR